MIVFTQSILLVGKRHMETIKPIVFKERKSRNSLGLMEKNNQFNLDESIDMTFENKNEFSVIKHERECLKNKLHEEDVEMQEQKLIADSEIVGLRQQLALTKFCLDRFKHNEVHYKFYTRFETYEMFNIFCTFLQPATLQLQGLKLLSFTVTAKSVITL